MLGEMCHRCTELCQNLFIVTLYTFLNNCHVSIFVMYTRRKKLFDCLSDCVLVRKKTETSPICLAKMG